MPEVNVVGLLKVTYRHPTMGMVDKDYTASLFTNINERYWTIITCASAFLKYDENEDCEYEAYEAKFYLQNSGIVGSGEEKHLAEFTVLQFNVFRGTEDMEDPDFEISRYEPHDKEANVRGGKNFALAVIELEKDIANYGLIPTY